MPVLENTTINISDLHYNDNFTYHYTGGITLAALELWPEAEEYFEICVTSLGTYPWALQMEDEVEAGSADISGQGSFPSPVLPPSYLRGYWTDITSYHALINAHP